MIGEMNRRRILTVFLFFFFTLPAARCQIETTYPKLDRLTVDDGLSQGQANCILQDRFGFIWVTTNNGLNRYDGTRFTVFKHDNDDENSIANNLVYRLLEDSHGRLWVNLGVGGFDLFEQESETFIHFNQCPNLPDALREKTYMTIIDDGNGGLLIATDKWMFRMSIFGTMQQNTEPIGTSGTEQFFQKHRVHFEPIRFPAEIQLINKKNVCNVIVDRSGNARSCLKSGLYAIDSETNLSKRISISRIYGWDSNNVDTIPTEIFARPNSDSLFMRFSTSTCIFNTRIKRIVAVLSSGNFPMEFSSVDLEGRIWGWETLRGVAYYDLNSRRCRQLESNDPRIQQAMRYVVTTYEDHYGNIWIGTSGYGILIYHPASEQFHTTGNNIFYRLTPVGDHQLALSRPASGGLFTGVPDNAKAHGPLLVYDIRSCSTLEPIPYSLLKEHLPANFQPGVFSIYSDSADSYWILGENLHHFIRTNSGWKYSFHDVPPCYSYMWDDQRGHLWISGGNDLYRFDKQSGCLERYPMEFKVKPESYATVQSMLFDNDGSIWLGTTMGLYRFNPMKKSWQDFVNRNGNPTSLGTDVLFTLCRDPRQPQRYLWAGTNGGGLIRFDISTGAFKRFAKEDGLPDDVVYGILSDDDGFLWMSTNNGIARFDPIRNSFRNFSQKDGLQGNEFNRTSYCKLPGNILCFGGMEGFNWFNPRTIRENHVSPLINITSISVNNLYAPFRHEHSVLRKPAYLTDEIVLPYQQNTINLEFSSFDLTDVAKNRYRYKLEEFDEDWIDAGTRKSATYTNLSPGRYTFLVNGTNSSGFWNSVPKRLLITILTPWYLSGWFKASVVLAVSLILYSIYRLRVKRLLQIQEIRNKIARDLHDEVGSNLSAIAIFSSVALNKTTSPSEVRSLNSRISSFTQVSQNALNDIIWMANSENDNFKSTLGRMHYIAMEILESKNIRLEVEADSSVEEFHLEMDKRRNLYLVFKEAINNIAKHAEATAVDVRIFRNNQQLHLVVQDDGKGFETAYTDRHDSKHNGLVNMRKRAEALYGTITIESCEGSGTRIELIFPFR